MNDTSQCGIPFPQQTPLANMTACCVGDVHVSNGCFQYCEVPGDEVQFAQCIRMNVFDTGAFGSDCNKAATSAGHRDLVEATGVRWKVAAMLVAVLGMRAFAS